MPWLKRNLFLVTGGLVAFGLLGLAGYFLYTKITRNQEVTDQLNQKTEELKNLVTRDPHPGTDKVDNIRAAKEEVKKVQAFLGQVQQYFPAARPETNQMTSRAFRELLDTTIYDLRRGAERAGVKVPDDYWFTFAAQKTAMSFPTNIVNSLAAQLTDIKALCEILYDAKVISLLGLRRVPIATEDSGQDYLSNKGATNNWTVSTPFELSFQGFSSELAAVLEGLIRSKNCFVVRNLAVDRADAPHTEETSTTAPSGDSAMSYMQMMQRRYGGAGGANNPYSRYGPMLGGSQQMSPELKARYGLAPSPTQPTQPTTPLRTAKGGNTILLEEKALRFTLSVDSVRLKPAGTAGKPARAAAPAAPADPNQPVEPAPPAQ